MMPSAKGNDSVMPPCQSADACRLARYVMNLHRRCSTDEARHLGDSVPMAFLFCGGAAFHATPLNQCR